MAKLITSFITLALIPLISGQCTVENAGRYLSRSVYDFSTEFISRIAQETDNHFVTSALSPWALIATISLGANDETLEEIEKVLRLHPHDCFNKKYFQIIKNITSASDETTLERSSSLFVDSNIPLKDIFKNRVLRTEVTNIEELRFENSDTVAAYINDYVSRSTRGQIDDIVSPSDLEEEYVILIDALYFKGTWHTQFSTSETEVSAFYDDKGKQIGDVYLMFAQMQAKVAYIKQIEAKVLELPYGANNRFSMLFLLPDNDVPVFRVLDDLKKISLRSILSLLREQIVSVQIPRFKISSDMDNLKELLIDMGLITMFDSTAAKFTDISNYDLYISSFIQKATIEVTEEGTVASAATEAILVGRSLNMDVNEFNANKPFIFMIIDRETELALFTGAYSKPNLF